MSFAKLREAAMADTYQPLSESYLDAIYSCTLDCDNWCPPSIDPIGAASNNIRWLAFANRQLLREVAHLKNEINTMRSLPRQEPTSEDVVVDWGVVLVNLGILRHIKDRLSGMREDYKSVDSTPVLRRNFSTLLSHVDALNETTRLLDHVIEFLDSAANRKGEQS